MRITKALSAFVAIIILFAFVQGPVTNGLRQVALMASEDLIGAETGKVLTDKSSSGSSELPVLGSFEKLKELLKNYQTHVGYGRGGKIIVTFNEAEAGSVGGLKGEAGGKAARQYNVNYSGTDAQFDADYSTTNVQVQGVDEADIVKTDGTYIYQVNRDRIAVMRA